MKEVKKSFVTCRISYFELGNSSFNPYVYYLTHGFVARTFNLLNCAFNLPTPVSDLAAYGFSPLTRGFELVTRGFELVTLRFELVTRISELVTRVLLFHIIDL